MPFTSYANDEIKVYWDAPSQKAVGYVKNTSPDGTAEIVFTDSKHIHSKLENFRTNLEYSASQAADSEPSLADLEDKVLTNESPCCGSSVGISCGEPRCYKCQQKVKLGITCRQCNGKGCTNKQITCEVCEGTGKE
jgi:hypothetical protein